MAFSQITDHVARALAALAEQYKGKPKVEGLLTAFINQVQKAEDGLWTLWTSRQFGASAGAAFLDVCGRIVGEPRSGRTDASYLVALRAKILLNVSSGTVEEIYAIFALVTAGTGITLKIIEWYPKAFSLKMGGVAVTMASDYYAALQRAKDAGAHAFLEYQNDTNANTYTLDTGPGLDVGKYADAIG